MIVTVSPLLCDANETCASLAFAARCRAVALGTARVALPPPPQSPSASSGAAAAQSPGGADGAGDETRDRASAARPAAVALARRAPRVKGQTPYRLRAFFVSTCPLSELSRPGFPVLLSISCCVPFPLGMGE